MTAIDARSGRRAVIAASIGNALEWYDFSVFALFAVYIGQNFFPQGDNAAQLLKAFMAFGLGFIARPLGALALGAYGDRVGRKPALTVTILAMAAGTGLIACAPPFSAIAFGAPLLILCGRSLQGFSAGGEIGGATAFLIEHAPARQRGKYAAWLQASMGISNILGALVATLVTSLLRPEQIQHWGWRVPFLLGLTIAPVGFWLRSTLDETPMFLADRAAAGAPQRSYAAQWGAMIADHPRLLLIGTAFSVLWAVSVYSLIIYMPVYVQSSLHFAPTQAFLAALIGNCLLCAGCLGAGALSDRFGRRPVAALGALLMLLLVYPLLAWLTLSHQTSTLILVQASFCLMVALFVGVAPAALSELFPTRVRSSGMALSYNLAVTVFGGFAPAILTWLTHQSGNLQAPAIYVMAAAMVGLVAIFFLPAKAASL